MDCSLPCSSIHGISQARVLEWERERSQRWFPGFWLGWLVTSGTIFWDREDKMWSRLWTVRIDGEYSCWLEKEMATHSSILAWKIPWTEEHGRLQSMGSQRVGHDWATSLHFTYISRLPFTLIIQCIWQSQKVQCGLYIISYVPSRKIASLWFIFLISKWDSDHINMKQWLWGLNKMRS